MFYTPHLICWAMLSAAPWLLTLALYEDLLWPIAPAGAAD